MKKILPAFIFLSTISASAFAQSDCAATTLGMVGCGPGTSPYTTSLGSTLGSRGTGFYTSDPDPTDNVYGAYPFTERLGSATDENRAPYSRTLGGSRTGCGNIYGMTSGCE